MAEKEDKDSKTEEATPRRVEEALQKGNTPFSREVGNVGLLLAVGFSLPYVAPFVANRFAPGLGMFLDRPSDFRLETSEDVIGLAGLVGWITLVSFWPVAIGLIVVGVLSSILQNKPRLVLERIKPDYSRISITKGFERIMGVRGQVEFLKALIKFIIICVAVVFIVQDGPQRVISYMLMNQFELPQTLISEIAGLFVSIGICVGLLAGVDLVWARLKWQIDLRMSRQDLKEEHKQAEGDPIVRARQRSLARDRARRRMMAAVPRATVVVANPTHYAVAMRYVKGESAAPIVVAKGVDFVALKIREIAESHDIPVIEDRALARSLYESVSTDRPIPPEFYRAVAEIILMLMSMQGARQGGH